MKGLFSWDSPWVQRFAMLTNLVMLNLLWLVCCIPLFTAGAATTALYYTIFRYHTKEDDEVLKPFFRAFKTNFKQATLLPLPLIAVLAVLVVEIAYLLTSGQGVAMLFVMIIVAVFLLCMLMHLLPLIGRFEMKANALLRTAFSLTILHFPITLVMIALLLVPAGIFVYDISLFLRLSVVWVGIWFALAAFLNGKLLLNIWAKHIPSQEQPEEKIESIA